MKTKMTKSIYVIFMMLFLTGSMFAQNQNVGINNNGSSPAASAMLDVSSTTKGFLPPRMNLDQIYSIQSPAEGLIVYNTIGKFPVYYDGTSWRKMDNTLVDFGFVIGQLRFGGVIFYIDGTGQHGLISATSDQSYQAQWGCYGTSLPGAYGTAIGTGNQNTLDIMAGCATTGIAARICGDLVLNGYSDWFLPSKDELNQMYLQKTAIGSLANDNYWSSSGFNAFNAWFQGFVNGFQDWGNKDGSAYVRAVRAF